MSCPQISQILCERRRCEGNKGQDDARNGDLSVLADDEFHKVDEGGVGVVGDETDDGGSTGFDVCDNVPVVREKASVLDRRQSGREDGYGHVPPAGREETSVIIEREAGGNETYIASTFLPCVLYSLAISPLPSNPPSSALNRWVSMGWEGSQPAFINDDKS